MLRLRTNFSDPNQVRSPAEDGCKMVALFPISEIYNKLSVAGNL